jgi:hypothetical protein
MGPAVDLSCFPNVAWCSGLAVLMKRALKDTVPLEVGDLIPTQWKDRVKVLDARNGCHQTKKELNVVTDGYHNTLEDLFRANSGKHLRFLRSFVLTSVFSALAMGPTCLLTTSCRFL